MTTGMRRTPGTILSSIGASQSPAMKPRTNFGKRAQMTPALTLRCWPGAAQWPLALATGGLVLLTDANLEPVAAKMRAFWFWRSSIPAEPPLFSPPWTNYAAWFLAASVLTFLLREDRVAGGRRVNAMRPVVIFLLLNAVFLAAHLGRFVRD
jgi:uncharacterized membrane protein